MSIGRGIVVVIIAVAGARLPWNPEDERAGGNRCSVAGEARSARAGRGNARGEDPP